MSNSELDNGSFVEIVNYSHNSSIPRDKIWYIADYNKKNDVIKIVSLNGKHSYRIDSWRVATLKYDKDIVKNQIMTGGFKYDVDTDEELFFV